MREVDKEQRNVDIIEKCYHKVLDTVAELINKQQRKIDHLLPILESKTRERK